MPPAVTNLVLPRCITAFVRRHLAGCPLAMLSMNAICNIWLRSLEATVPCFPRSYVDDVSVTVMEDSPEALIKACRDVYSCSTKFVNATGGKLTQRNVLLLVPPLLKVPFLTTSLILMNFGSLAGSFVSRSDDSVSPPLELQRMNAWLKTAQERAIFHLHGTIVADVYPELVHNSLGALALIACQRLRLMRTNLLNYDPP